MNEWTDADGRSIAISKIESGDEGYRVELVFGLALGVADDGQFTVTVRAEADSYDEAATKARDKMLVEFQGLRTLLRRG